MFSNQELSYYYTLYTDCLQLYNIRLAGQPNTEQGIRIGTPDICISPSGKLMCYLFELELSNEESEELAKRINAIDIIVKRLSE